MDRRRRPLPAALPLAEGRPRRDRAGAPVGLCAPPARTPRSPARPGGRSREGRRDATGRDAAHRLRSGRCTTRRNESSRCTTRGDCRRSPPGRGRPPPRGRAARGRPAAGVPVGDPDPAGARARLRSRDARRTDLHRRRRVVRPRAARRPRRLDRPPSRRVRRGNAPRAVRPGDGEPLGGGGADGRRVAWRTRRAVEPRLRRIPGPPRSAAGHRGGPGRRRRLLPRPTRRIGRPADLRRSGRIGVAHGRRDPARRRLRRAVGPRLVRLGHHRHMGSPALADRCAPASA
mgnify:CR=1 FL=1